MIAALLVLAPITFGLEARPTAYRAFTESTFHSDAGDVVVRNWTQRTLTLEPGGGFELTMKRTRMEAVLAGNLRDVPGQATTLATLDPRGLPLAMRGDGVNDEAFLLARLTAWVVPEHPVQVGDRWTVVSDQPDVELQFVLESLTDGLAKVRRTGRLIGAESASTSELHVHPQTGRVAGWEGEVTHITLGGLPVERMTMRYEELP